MGCLKLKDEGRVCGLAELMKKGLQVDTHSPCVYARSLDHFHRIDALKGLNLQNQVDLYQIAGPQNPPFRFP